MKYETIKTTILAVLVLASIFLTWGIWNFQPHYETIEKRSIKEMSVASQETTENIIKPSQILLNKLNTYHGTNNENEIDSVINSMKKWSFYGNERVKSLTSKDVNILLKENNHLDLIFPEDVPVKVYKDVFQFNDKRIPDAYFNRIIIDFSNNGHKDNNIYFLSTDERKAYICTVNYRFIQTLTKNINSKLDDQYQTYLPYELYEGKTMLLPRSSIKMITYRNVTDEIPPEEFKRALFPDPNFVKKGQVGDIDEYTNGTSMLRTDKSNEMLYYINPSEDTTFQSSINDLVKRSLDFMNHPGMWTDTYRYFKVNEKKHEVHFRMFMQGYPVFSNDETTDISLQWGENEIYQYNRPYYTFTLKLPLKVSEVNLPNGVQVIQDLKKIPNIDLNSVEDLAIGYELIKDTDYNSNKQNDVLEFEPAWFYQYRGEWLPVSPDSLGGKQRGLE